MRIFAQMGIQDENDRKSISLMGYKVSENNSNTAADSKTGGGDKNIFTIDK